MSFHPVLFRRLESIADLSDADRKLLESLPISGKRLAAGEDLVRQGDTPSHSALLVKGVLARYQELSDGTRQTVSFHFPGEIPDLHSLYIRRMDHSLGAVTESLVGLIGHEDLHRVLSMSPSLVGLLWRESLIDAAMFRQWITNNGRRGSLAGTAHLLCEFVLRAKAIGALEPDGTWYMPFTQAQLSEAVGLSLVQLNRTLRTLRERNVVVIEQGRMRVLDWDELKKIAGFDPTYLHLKHEH